MKNVGYVLIGAGLFLFGIIKWQIPLVLIISGIAAIFLDKYYKF